MSSKIRSLKDLVNKLVHFCFLQLHNLIPNASLNLPALTSIRLNDNLLSELDDNWLSGLSSLNRLYLMDNSLKTIGSDTFSGIINLRQLHLDNNAIQSIQCGAFKVSAKLQTYIFNRRKLIQVM